MEQVYVRESNGEVLICLDKHMGDRLHALEEAGKVVLRETLRERERLRRNKYIEDHNDGVSREF